MQRGEWVAGLEDLAKWVMAWSDRSSDKNDGRQSSQWSLEDYVRSGLVVSKVSKLQVRQIVCCWNEDMKTWLQVPVKASHPNAKRIVDLKADGRTSALIHWTGEGNQKARNEKKRKD